MYDVLTHDEHWATLVDAAGRDRELPEVPDWLTDSPAAELVVSCDWCGASSCGCEDAVKALLDEEQARLRSEDEDTTVGWAVPGVTGLDDHRTTALPPTSSLVADLDRALRALEAVDPAQLPGTQALVDAQVALQAEQRLHVLNLRRTGDVAARGLHSLTGFPTAASWLRHHRPDGDTTDASFASALRAHPQLRQDVEDGLLPLSSARRVAAALRKVGPHLDRPDGLIDGLDGTEVLQAVVMNVVEIVCRELHGLVEDDPRLTELIAQGHAILGTAPSQAAAFEAATTWLARELPASRLRGPLDELVCALLPSVLDDRAEKARAWRSLTLTPRTDGQGWRVEGDLDLECGERLFVALRAELQRDPANPDDTAAWAAAREAAGDEAREQVQDAWGLGLQELPTRDDSGSTLPRGRRQRMHDALSSLLDRYLGADLAGTVGKNPVQISVLLPEAQLTRKAGASPARTSSGTLVPARLVRRWWCDADVTGFVMSLGGKALRAVHTLRTAKGIERKALDLEGGGRCVGDGCCSGRPSPFNVLRPHHVHDWATYQLTCLDDTLLVCDHLHHLIHDLGQVVRLADGRYLCEDGLLTEDEALARTLAPAPF